MDKNQLNEIIACLPRERTLFHYCRDRYAALLLRDLVGSGRRVGELKKTRLAQLLDKPSLRNYLAGLPDGMVTCADLDNFWPWPLQTFILTVGSWGNSARDSYYQTSRPGYNLVLQLNFAEQHSRRYRQLLAAHLPESWFNSYCHPILKRGDRSYYRHTLAWARIDLDFASDEALIEEIQSDWISEGDWMRQTLSPVGQDRDYWRNLQTYLNEVLKDYARIWDEAMLSAAIDFIRRELGISRIYYHTYETGNQLKGLKGSRPPRSLYTRLPRRFCFERVGELPSFLLRDRCVRRGLKKVAEPACYRLASH